MSYLSYQGNFLLNFKHNIVFSSGAIDELFVLPGEFPVKF